MRQIKTSYSNETHQLLVSVSRHLYFNKKGILTYQTKPMEVAINNYWKSKQEHLVYYVLLDQFSGNFIFEIATTKKMLPLAEFLYFGWSQNKYENHFWGLPLKISVTKRVASSDLFEGLKNLGIEPHNPVQGFSAGVHIIRNLEDNIYHAILIRSALHYLGSIHNHKGETYKNMLEGFQKENYIDKWRYNLRSTDPRPLPDHDSFISAFPDGSGKNIGLPLFATDDTRMPGNKAPLPSFLTSINDIPFSQAKLDKAEETNDIAWELDHSEKGLKLAYQALDISPYCADALNYLAIQSHYTDEKLMLYKRAVQVGKTSLGDRFIRENTGYFWGILETRPYMRALFGLAESYWDKGQHEKAIDIYWEMLRLNPSDNQGIRYILGFCLLKEKRDEELDRLFIEYDKDNEQTCFMLYNKALHFYSKKNYCEAEQLLLQAINSNEHVYKYLSGDVIVPYVLPDRYGWGDDSEAVIYTAATKDAWNNAPGALEWFQHVLSHKEKSVLFRETTVTIEQALQEFLADQGQRLTKSTLNKYQNIIEFLEICLENYGHTSLNETEKQLFDQYYSGGEERVFCKLFGPEKIVDNIGEFLGYFMLRKVYCGKNMLRASGTVINKLALWMLEKGYLEADGADLMIEDAKTASIELPAAEDFSKALHSFVKSQPETGKAEEELDDYFEVIKVEKGKLHLESLDEEETITVTVPEKVSKLCREGWMINLLLVKTAKGWVIADSGGVLPG